MRAALERPLAARRCVDVRPLELPHLSQADDVAVRIAALDADIFGLVPLLDQLDATGGKPVAQRENGVAVLEAAWEPER